MFEMLGAGSCHNLRAAKYSLGVPRQSAGLSTGPCNERSASMAKGWGMNILDMMQHWREQRDAIPTEKIKTLGLTDGAGTVRKEPALAESTLPDTGRTEPACVERAERRIDITGTAMLIGRHGKLGVEQASMQNVSTRGVRVISTSQWYADDTILVSLPDGHFTSAARVAYCDVLTQGQFAVGLEFVGSSKPLDLGALATQ